jgi:hypothetical protein
MGFQYDHHKFRAMYVNNSNAGMIVVSLAVFSMLYTVVLNIIEPNLLSA